MDVDEGLVGSRCDDHKIIPLIQLKAMVRFGQGGKEQRLAIRSSNVLGLLPLRICRIEDPHKPNVDRRECTFARPQAFEEFTRHHCLGQRIDCVRPLPLWLGRRPAPFDAIQAQLFCDLADHINTRLRRPNRC